MNMELNKWINESTMKADGDKISIYAPALTDYFNDPIADAEGKFSAPMGNAPFFYTEIDGDFVIRVKVNPNFKSTYDAACIMVIDNENTWIKAAFERSDFGTNAVVSVVTNKVSDDANGCNISADSVWLQVVRVGDNFAVHYSVDGEKFDMVRVFLLPTSAVLKVGIEAQCPTGDGGERMFEGLEIERRTVSNLRQAK